MKLYLGIKYHEDMSNRIHIEHICKVAEEENIQIVCVHRDIEKWSNAFLPINELMSKTFKIIENSDAVLIEFSEKGVGLGIEAGFAVARNIPVYVLLQKGKEISSTLKGICEQYFEYETDEDIRNILKLLAR